MRFFRYFTEPGAVALGVEQAGRHFQIRAGAHDFNEEFFQGGGALGLREQLRSDPALLCPLKAAPHFAPAVARPSKIIGVGLNYRAHAEETGASVPVDPKLFMKATTALCGAFDDLVLPRASQKTDYEVELAVIIGKRASYVRKENALDYVGGYSLVNDYSEREFQKERAGQFVKGKSADTFCPLGPYWVAPDAVEPGNLRLWLKVNDELRQDATTSEMIFDVASLVSRISEYMTLLPGDVICTGTPSGVGMGRTPQEFLRPGDVLHYGIDGIAETRQCVRAFPGYNG